MGDGLAPVRARRSARNRTWAASPALMLVRGEAAWAAVLACGLLTVAAIVVLGPPLGRALFGPGPERFWPGIPLAPEPAEHGRYAIAILGPLLSAMVVLWISRRGSGMHPLVTWIASASAQTIALAFAVLCVTVENHGIVISGVSIEGTSLISLHTVKAAAVMPLIVLGIPHRRRILLALARHARETPARRVVVVALAVTFTALWMLTAVNSENSLGIAKANNLIPWDMNESFAVLDGRTPFADFHAQYSQLWPYVAAVAMKLVGPSASTWTITMTTISGVALLAVYAVFRRILGNSLLALALYLPFLATGFFMMLGPTGNRFSMAGIFSVWPMRYAGPYLLAWLTARHVDGAAPRRARLLFVAAGLVVLNNSEFGAGAFAGTVAAVACRTPPWPWRSAAQLIGDVVAGLLGAVLLLALLTLARTGSLPHVGLLLEYPQLYGVDGWVLEPMPTLGLHLFIYMTFIAAIVVAIARVGSAGEQRVLTSMLAWSGAFGLIASSYYIGRSDFLNLAAMFSAWCLALSLLVIVVIRRIAARVVHIPTAAEFAVLLGFGLTVCSITQIPAPGPQLARLRNTATPNLFKQGPLTRFVAERTQPGEHVAILAPLSHRIAYDAGIVNISAYSSIESMPTREQLQRTLERMRSEGVHKLFVGAGTVPSEVRTLAEVTAAIEQAGFSVRATTRGLSELTDAPGSTG